MVYTEQEVCNHTYCVYSTRGADKYGLLFHAGTGEVTLINKIFLK